ncbi:TPA: hypothetical protein N0F65_005309 [Lagenidium giganteum]|uniref:PH domain-containing protein n=1 Tax=Lagenidium giganteum TaxID=4803 RepID=A0AAV2YXJ6_9STRA|nr:TPA: hypothetical protein N0F65_005309 [Lagenidium giganteum]
MTNVLNGSFISWKNTTDTYGIESRLMEAQEQHTRLKMQVFWQLLLTGFEVATYRVGKRAKKRVLWLALDGRLYLDGSKKDKKSSSAMFLYDVFKIQRGSEAVAFTKSTSAREARNKDELSFSIHGKHGKEEEKVFACQVLKGSVRTIVVENLETLLQLIQGDSDGEYPVNVQKRIALHYAATGDVLTLRQVEDMLRHEEGKADFRTAFEELSDDEDDSGNESDSHKSDGQRKILG